MKRTLGAAVIGMALLGGMLGCTTTTTTTTTRGANSDHKSSSADAASVNVQLGVDYLRQGQLALAQTKLERALKEDSHNPDAHGALALLDERLGKVDEADREYRRALVLSRHSPSMLNNYAVYLCSHARPDEGVRYFEEAATNPLYSTPWAAYTNAGVCLRAGHRDQDAMVRFNRALQANPAYAEAAYQASDLDFSMQRDTQARERIDAFLMSNPATPDLLLLGWRIAQAQADIGGHSKYAYRLMHEFPKSQQTHAVQVATARAGSG